MENCGSKCSKCESDWICEIPIVMCGTVEHFCPKCLSDSVIVEDDDGYID